MIDEIKVSVVEFGNRPFYMLRWTDPMSGRVKTESSKIERGGKKQRDLAQNAAGALEEKLRAGTWHAPSKITWDAFRERYEQEVLAGLADGTLRKASGTFNLIEEAVNPQRLRSLTAARISHFQMVLRDRGRSEATIKSHVAHLSAALNWAVDQGMISKAPKLPKQKRAKRATRSTPMKGRPITLEEFERMLGRVEAVLTEQPNKSRKEPKLPTPECVESWKHYLRGLWLSGLRLAESLELWWEDREDRLSVDLTGKRPMLLIPAALEKGNRDRVLPMAPEFAEFLLQTPEAERVGPVFNPQAQRGERRLLANRVGEVVGKTGELARVVVSTAPKTGKVKYASAHDLRRSFGTRWARRVMPPVLMELMRHESIDTTLRFYVGRNAQATADILWEAHEKATGNDFGSAGQKQPSEGEAKKDTNPLQNKGL